MPSSPTDISNIKPVNYNKPFFNFGIALWLCFLRVSIARMRVRRKYNNTIHSSIKFHYNFALSYSNSSNRKIANNNETFDSLNKSSKIRKIFSKVSFVLFVVVVANCCLFLFSRMECLGIKRAFDYLKLLTHSATV